MNQYTHPERLIALQKQAVQHAQLETTRQQDHQALLASLDTVIKIIKHWTIGIQIQTRTNLKPRKSL